MNKSTYILPGLTGRGTLDLWFRNLLLGHRNGEHIRSLFFIWKRMIFSPPLAQHIWQRRRFFMRDFNSVDLFAKHGGVHYRTNVPKQQINLYVRSLPEHKRQSMFQVMKELESAGMITIYNDGLFADGEGEVGGSQDC
jgi:hypothetical protein